MVESVANMQIIQPSFDLGDLSRPKKHVDKTPHLRDDLPDNVLFHVGVSGGKDSAALLIWMVRESGIPHHLINATFCDTGWEHEWTYAHLDMLREKVFPIQTLKPELDFVGLVKKKGRFPSAKARFCTQSLKIYPSQDHILSLQQAGYHVIAVSGVRADESEARKLQPEWDYSGTLLCESWRPMIRWELEDVLAIHKKHGIPMNPLYALGAERVGCYPCINSVKKEVRGAALNFPDRITEIRELEAGMEEGGNFSGFFHASKIPKRYRTKPFVTKSGDKFMVAKIDDVVRWSMTGKNAQGSYLDDPPEPISCSSGFCE